MRSRPQRKLNLNEKFQWNRLGFEMVASLVVRWGTRKFRLVSFSSLLAAEAIMLFFLFLFILVHSIIKNGEKRDKRYVKI